MPGDDNHDEKVLYVKDDKLQPWRAWLAQHHIFYINLRIPISFA